MRCRPEHLQQQNKIFETLLDFDADDWATLESHITNPY